MILYIYIYRDVITQLCTKRKDVFNRATEHIQTEVSQFANPWRQTIDVRAYRHTSWSVTHEPGDMSHGS